MMDFPFSLTLYSLKEDLNLLKRERRGPLGSVFALPGPLPETHTFSFTHTHWLLSLAYNSLRQVLLAMEGQEGGSRFY